MYTIYDCLTDDFIGAYALRATAEEVMCAYTERTGLSAYCCFERDRT